MTQDPRYLNQRVRAGFDLVRLTAVGGDFGTAETIARTAIQQAADGGLWGYAALGQIELANTLLNAGHPERAAQELARAIALAIEHGAKKTELRARIQEGSFQLSLGNPREAIKALEEPLKFVKDQGFARFEADAKRILSRAHEDLEEYEVAGRLSDEVLSFAKSIEDQLLTSSALELKSALADEIGAVTGGVGDAGATGED